MNLFYLAVFIFGTLIGSFLNVVILRLGTGRGLGGRSGCANCAKKLVWYELVPVLSFLFLQGRCSGCRSKISKQYILVELLTGAVFALIVYQLGIAWETLYACVVASLLIVIAAYDYKHMIIPDSFVAAVAIVAFIRHPSYILAGAVFFSFFALLWLISKGTWIGFGDAKLGLALGLVAGLEFGTVGLMLAFWIGAIVGVLLIIVSKLLSKKRITMRSEIPFGPFMIAGVALSLFFNLGFMWVSNLFMFYS